VRTPMAWDASANGGFSSGEPWLPLHDDWPDRNAAAERVDPASMLSLHRDLLRLRRRHPALAIGDMTMMAADGAVLGYERRHGAERVIVLLNMSADPAQTALPAGVIATAVLSTASTIEPDRNLRGTITLQPDEGLLLLAVPA